MIVIDVIFQRLHRLAESLQYGGADSSYGSNGAGHGHCCCANGDPNSPGSFQSHHPPSSGSCSQTACAGCSSSVTGMANITSTGPISSGGSTSNTSAVGVGPHSATVSSAPSAVKFELGRIEVSFSKRICSVIVKPTIIQFDFNEFNRNQSNQ